MSIGFSIIGLGTIGTGVFQSWQKNHRLICERRALDIKLVEVADIHRPRHLDLTGVRYSADAFHTIAADDVQVVIELIGGTTIAYDLVKTALQNGKSVITANKALIATYGDELHDLAHRHRSHLYYEASVCGGIPLLNALEHGLVANRIESITGTVNGTCNYILTRMQEENLDFAEALRCAQELGFAEADPSFDIEGKDAAHKTTILAALAFGVAFDLDACDVIGIKEIDRLDLQHSQKMGFRLMHLAHCRADNNGIQRGVFPGLIPQSHILANVQMEMNAALVEGDRAGSTFYYGAGAGAFPTSSAVLADLATVSQHLRLATGTGRMRWTNPDQATTSTNSEWVSPWYLGMSGSPTELAAIDANFAALDIEIDRKLYYNRKTDRYFDNPSPTNGDVDLILLTGPVSAAGIRRLTRSAKPGIRCHYPILLHQPHD